MMLLQTLTVVLGLVLVLALFSLLATTVMEWLVGLLHLKSKNLLQSLQQILAGSDVSQRVYLDFIHHVRFRQLAPHPQKEHSYPSYLAAEDFQAILYDLLGRYHGAPIQHAQDLAEGISLLSDVDLKQALMSLYHEVQGDPTNFRFRLQTWYDSLMEVASDRYQKRTRRFLFALGLLIAIVFNVDTLQIFQALQSNPAKTREVLGLVSTYDGKGQPATANPTENLQPFEPPAGEVQPFEPPAGEVQPFQPPAGEAAPPGSTQAAPSPPPAARQATPSATSAGKPLAGAVGQRLLERELKLAESPLGLGWDEEQLQALDTGKWPFKLLGWGMTALAISFGAGFWFDLLRKALAVRS